MLPPADPLPRELQDAFDAVRARLGRLGTSWRYYATVGSTSDVATLLASGSGARSASAAEGAVVIADAQTAGRGRRGRSWFSPPGSGLYISTVLAPGNATSPERATSLLTLAAGVALAEAIERVTGLAAPIKWPNDLLVGRRKLAGILAEGLAQDPAAGVGPVVLGYGVNIGHMSVPADLLDRTTSLETELGRADRSRGHRSGVARGSCGQIRRPARRTVRCYSRRVAPPVAVQRGDTRDMGAWALGCLAGQCPARWAA